MCKYPYTETVQSPNRLVHYALVFRTPATRRNPTNKIEITLKIEQAVLYFYIKGTRSLRFKYSKIPHVESIQKRSN